jgi:hypothetical protein
LSIHSHVLIICEERGKWTVRSSGQVSVTADISELQ